MLGQVTGLLQLSYSWNDNGQCKGNASWSGALGWPIPVLHLADIEHWFDKHQGFGLFCMGIQWEMFRSWISFWRSVSFASRYRAYLSLDIRSTFLRRYLAGQGEEPDRCKRWMVIQDDSDIGRYAITWKGWIQPCPRHQVHLGQHRIARGAFEVKITESGYCGPWISFGWGCDVVATWVLSVTTSRLHERMAADVISLGQNVWYSSLVSWLNSALIRYVLMLRGMWSAIRDLPLHTDQQGCRSDSNWTLGPEPLLSTFLIRQDSSLCLKSKPMVISSRASIVWPVDTWRSRVLISSSSHRRAFRT